MPLINIKGVAIAMTGKIIIEIENLKPSKEIIQAVTVVPILAPIITAIAPVRVKSPAFTKLTTITVVAEED